jgi:amidohydrolase
MRSKNLSFFVILVFFLVFKVVADPVENISASVDQIAPQLIEIADYIHDNPELGNQEFKAVETLTAYLASNGFSVEKGVAGLETAFVATYVNAGGNGPAISFLAEYDALAGLGHACGHNVIAASCVGAAVALSKNLGSVPAKVIVFGCPAEETTSGKIPMAKEGLFKQADVGLQMHPGSGEASIGSKTLALNLVDFIYDGKASHAAASPEMGRSALDGVMLMFMGTEFLREHVKSDIRIHGIVTNGGAAANIVPEKASARFYVRGAERPYLNSVVERVYNIARGAAMMTETKLTIQEIKQYDNVVNVQSFIDLGAEVSRLYGVEKIRKVQSSDAAGGSTDFGTASSQIPCMMFSLPVASKDVAGHSREYAEATKSPLAHEVVLASAKIMALTGYKLIEDPALLAQIKADWQVAVSGD